MIKACLSFNKMQNCVEITTWHFHKKRLKILQNKHQIIAYQSNLAFFEWGPVWPEKIRQMSIKVAQNDFTRKIKDFDTFIKIA